MGAKCYKRLKAEVEARGGEDLFRVSLQGVKQTDTSFPKHGLLALAKELRGKKAFCLADASDQEFLENWGDAATIAEFPLIAWGAEGYKLLGPKPGGGLAEVFEFVMGREATGASDLKQKFGFQVPNASNKLKKLFDEGYVWRRVRVAGSGGIEHDYLPIK
jgi:hypothetical protein